MLLGPSPLDSVCTSACTHSLSNQRSLKNSPHLRNAEGLILAELYLFVTQFSLFYSFDICVWSICALRMMNL